jgi:hypothetical protein
VRMFCPFFTSIEFLEILRGEREYSQNVVSLSDNKFETVPCLKLV